MSCVHDIVLVLETMKINNTYVQSMRYFGGIILPKNFQIVLMVIKMSEMLNLDT